MISYMPLKLVHERLGDVKGIKGPSWGDPCLGNVDPDLKWNWHGIIWHRGFHFSWGWIKKSPGIEVGGFPKVMVLMAWEYPIHGQSMNISKTNQHMVRNKLVFQKPWCVKTGRRSSGELWHGLCSHLPAFDGRFSSSFVRGVAGARSRGGYHFRTGHVKFMV